MEVVVTTEKSVVSPFKVGDFVACDMEDGTQFAEVQGVLVDTENQRVQLMGVWGNDSCITAGEKGWNYADDCRLATEEEKEQDERRRVFARKGRRNNEFHSSDQVADGEKALTVLWQDKENDIVTVAVINSDETYECLPEDLELTFAKEDMVG